MKLDRANLRETVQTPFVLGQVDWPSGTQVYVRTVGTALDDVGDVSEMQRFARGTPVIETDARGARRAVATLRDMFVAEVQKRGAEVRFHRHDDGRGWTVSFGATVEDEFYVDGQFDVWSEQI
jgi:hypothetical protein